MSEVGTLILSCVISGLLTVIVIHAIETRNGERARLIREKVGGVLTSIANYIDTERHG